MKLTANTIINHLSNGGKIRRKSWQEHLYLFQGKSSPLSSKTPVLRTQKRVDIPLKDGSTYKVNEMWKINISQLEATDWVKIH